MRFDVLTIFPDMFSAYLRDGIAGRAVKRGLLDVRLVNIRDFARGAHKTTDDRPYGGGDGMVMRPGPISRALGSIERNSRGSLVILLTPQGETFNQSIAWDISSLEQVILVCGRYEGVDERIRLLFVDREISIGDYVLSGGELAAMVIMDSVCRLIPGTLGGEKSSFEDSFQDSLLEYPHYTRPRVFEGLEVPEILLSGDHARIRGWRRKEALKRTFERRPDLLAKAKLDDEDLRILEQIRSQTPACPPEAEADC
ncbi:MAG: tRNA (guanosine(37)-N1)-methyltransferase TrmD [Desulfobacteraceae bacterium]|nr:MAG: tRNA (guanosine(37)-N1)-methyltransferase TrmD [Desulfobacteraceae bacterium]